jgi:hypothetical protein
VAFIGKVAQARPDTMSTSGYNNQCAGSNTLFLTALSFEVAYKYVFGRFGEVSLGLFDSLTSSWVEHIPSHSSALLDCLIKVRLSDFKCICL